MFQKGHQHFKHHSECYILSDVKSVQIIWRSRKWNQDFIQLTTETTNYVQFTLWGNLLYPATHNTVIHLGVTFF